jgi:hypothetical protein
MPPMTRVFGVLVLVLAAGAGWADGLYAMVRADAGWAGLTGWSSTQHFHYGWRAGAHEGYLFLTHTAMERGRASAPSRLLVRGLVHGATYRYWVPGLPVSAFASVSEIVSGDDEGRLDPRAGLDLDAVWQRGRTETRADGTAQWLPRLGDAVAVLRLRHGPLPQSGRPRPYAVGLVAISTSGDTPADNRMEAGVGVQYRHRTLATASAELRLGYAYRGAIGHRAYVNPVMSVAVGW